MKVPSIKFLHKAPWAVPLALGVVVVGMVGASLSGKGNIPADVVTEKPAQTFTYCITGDELRDDIVQFARKIITAEGGTITYPQSLEVKGEWKATVKAAFDGAVHGEGKGDGGTIAQAVEKATRALLKNEEASLPDDSDQLRLIVTIACSSARSSSMIETNGKGRELVDNVVVVREYDRARLEELIRDAKGYLLRMLDPELHGAHKYYYATKDSFEERLHTIYTSSLVYTLLKLYDYDKDALLLKQAIDSGEYILSMQNLDKESKRYGAFYYSFFLDTDIPEQKFVVGTTSKTIYTLLELYRRTDDERYLDAAKLAADWLLTMQREDGSMKPYVIERENGKWFSSTNESTLYNGQVLSALSRMYRQVGKKEYLEAATRIADRLKQKIESEGCYVGDDFRTPNPISSSWLIMSLMDYYKATEDKQTKNIVLTCGDELLGRQMDNESDIGRFGRWPRGYSTSGNGWINEVFVEVYNFCRDVGESDCDKYKDSIVKVTRWLIQNTYTEENSFLIPNPEMARGGLYWDINNRYVRTDSVCHGLNAYVGIVPELDEGVLISVPEE